MLRDILLPAPCFSPAHNATNKSDKFLLKSCSFSLHIVQYNEFSIKILEWKKCVVSMCNSKLLQDIGEVEYDVFVDLDPA